VIAIAGCQQPAPRLTEADEAAIRAVPEAHGRHFLAGQLNGVVETFAEDAVYLPPNEPAVVGRSAIGGKLAELSRLTGYNAPVEEIDGQGDLAVVRGSYSLAFQSGGRLTDSGKYVYVLRRQPGGSWLIAWAIWNSDLPAQSLDLEPNTVQSERH
jgi:ketosteroid isomerase-like protein